MEFLSPDQALDFVEGTVIFVDRSQPSPAVVSTLEARVQGLARAHKQPLAYLQVVLDVPTTGRIDEESRAAMMAAGRRHMTLFESAAMVLIKQGFMGAAMRAMVSSALMSLRAKVPFRVFGTEREAVEWLCSAKSATGRPRDAAKVMSALAAITGMLQTPR
jgi:hypothetical protein